MKGAFTSPAVYLVLLLLPGTLTRGQVKCPVIKCPDTSTCQDYMGAPVCVCPKDQRLINNKCTSNPLDRSDWLDWHNNARAAVGSVPIQWDDALVVDARKTAEAIGATSKCPLTHSIPKGQGQNLAGGAQRIAPTFGNKDAVLKWVKEGALYTYAKFDAKAGGCKGGDWKKCGHYLQVIWNSTTSVGCAVAKCSTSKHSTARIWACNYKPAGNVIGRRPYDQDPCFVTTCPASATCDSSSGSAVCKCPTGQAVIKGVCAADPCVGRPKCPGDKVCDSSSGSPVCACPDGTVPAASGSTTCLDPLCLGVVCPGTSSCVLSKQRAPVCVCPPQQVLQGSTCTASPTSPLIQTSVAVYGGGVPLVIRFTKKNECVSLNGLAVASYKIVWKAPSTEGTSLPSGVEGSSCSQVQFWNKARCIGKSMGWPSGTGELSKTATGLFKEAKAIKCV